MNLRHSEVNLDDVARSAGVSTATVSRVVNRKGYVSEATRSKVERVIRDLGYQQNQLASSLMTKRSNLVALILDNIANPFYPQLALGLEATAEKNGFNVILCNIESDLEKEKQYVCNLLGRQVDGIIFVASRAPEYVYQNEIKIKVPVVRLDRDIHVPNCDGVILDQLWGSYNITKHLIEKGYKRIAHISGPKGYYTARERMEGYSKALFDYHYRIVQRLVIEGDYSIESGKHAMTTLLKLTSRPDAVFAANDLMAFGAIDVIKRSGLQVPNDIAVAGFDDIPFAALYTPSLTTVSQPTYQMGSLAMQMLIERISGNISLEAREIILQPSITVREST